MVELLLVDLIEQWINYLAIMGSFLFLSMIDGLLIKKVPHSHEYRFRFGSTRFISKPKAVGLKFLEIVVALIISPFVESYFNTIFQVDLEINLVNTIFLTFSLVLGLIIIVRRYLDFDYSKFETVVYRIMAVVGLFFLLEAFQVINVISLDYYLPLK